jgi:CHAT domain-containing protein
MSLSNVPYQVESTNPPHIWWCPTGPLAFLPIHAAGLYNQDGVGEKVSDYVVSSYTPTLASILQQQRSLGGPFNLLTVALPSTPYASSLPKTKEEVGRIQSLATGLSLVELMSKDATVQRVVDEMKASDWVHLACHGEQVIPNAMASGLLLHDKKLELSEMIKMSLPKADFAFLSACQTAVGDEKVAEESVHLASGMLFAGYRGLIATMWSINDKDAPQIAEDVYREILKGGKPNRKEAARALHKAVKRLREESKGNLLSWVPFIHIGR